MVAAPHGGIRIMAEPPTPDAPVRTTAVFRPDPRHQYHPDETTLQARALFRELPIFRDVPAHPVRELARMAGSHVFAPGEVIVRMGDFGSTMYVINSGKVEVVLERPTGNVVLATLGRASSSASFRSSTASYARRR